MRNSSSLDWLRFMHTPNDYRVSQLIVRLKGYPNTKITVSKEKAQRLKEWIDK